MTSISLQDLLLLVVPLIKKAKSYTFFSNKSPNISYIHTAKNIPKTENIIPTTQNAFTISGSSYPFFSK